ncbi:MAG: hypothetical protein AAFW66_16730, partial [Pseudomonadota bacterium]
MSEKNSPLRLFWAEFRENKIAVFALAVALLMSLLALFASVVSPQNPYDLANLSLMDSRRPPGFVGTGGYVHLLGTDPQGRDLLSAIFYGLRISIQIGLAAGFVSLSIGTFLGITAAYVGGKVETFIMRQSIAPCLAQAKQRSP